MNKNKLLIIILILLILLVIILVIISKTKTNKNEKIVEVKEKYYEYFSESGVLNKEYIKNVTLPENYLEKSYNEKSIDEVLEKILNESNFNIPNNIIETYENEKKLAIKNGADGLQKDVNEYLKENYDSNDMDEYIQKNRKYYIEEIKKDIFYQALANDLNIVVNENDVKKYFSNLINEGYTYDELKDNYGEKLMYKYTLEDKIKNVIEEKIRK